MINIADPVRYHAQRRPRMAALIDGAETLDWAGLQSRVDAAAFHLHAHGVSAGDIVVLSVRNDMAHVVLLLALARLGATTCMLDWRCRDAERDAVLSAVKPRWLLVDAPTAASRVATLVADPTWHELPAEYSAPPVADSPPAPALLLLSSGTTGTPKAARLGHEAASWRAVVRMHSLGFEPSSRVLSTMPLHAASTLAGLLGQLLAGATTILMPPLFGADEVVAAVQAHGIDHVSLVPTMLRELLATDGAPGPMFPGLRTLVSTGAVLHADEKRLVLERLTPNLYEYYGSTTTGPMAVCRPEDVARSPAAVGRAVLFTQIDIVDEDDRSLPAGRIGRVRVRSPGLASDVIGDAAGSQEGLGAGCAYPGDLGRLDESGLLYLEGRAGSVIIRGGQNLHPEEIEGVLRRHPAIDEAVVVGRPDARLGQVPVALLVLRRAVDPVELEAHCRQHLSAQKVPVAFRFVADLPKTRGGKVQRAGLDALVGEA
jgi:acyl-CoA synthetase (AMP-forming)/AMP-acid ligase II